MGSNRTTSGWVAGRVQAVSYRAALKREAERLGVVGWVRNLADGRVEFCLSGPAEQVDALLAWAKGGPRLARVDLLEVESDLVSDLGGAPVLGFEIRY